MKKIIISWMMIVFALCANAQQKGTRYNDTLAAPPTPPPPTQGTQANKVEEVKMKSRGEIDAEKEAKDKGSNKNQTQVNPNKIAPIVGDTVKRPKPVRNQ